MGEDLAPACCTDSEGMEINSHSIRVINARQTVLELILPTTCRCLICAKSGKCNCRTWRITWESGRFITRANSQPTEDTSPPSFAMWISASCRRCEMMCNEVQTVGVLSAINRGFNAVVSPAFEMNLDHSVCTYAAVLPFAPPVR